MSSLPDEVQKNLDALEQVLGALEQQVDQLGSLPPLKEVVDRVTPMENAQLNTTLAYTLDSLYFVYLKSVGASTESHEVHKELERVKDYMKKLKQVDQEQKERAIMPRVDQGAAERFVRHGLNIPKSRDAPSSASASSTAPAEIDPSSGIIVDTQSDLSAAAAATTGRAGRAPRPVLQPSKKSNQLSSSARSLVTQEPVHVQFNKMKASGAFVE